MARVAAAESAAGFEKTGVVVAMAGDMSLGTVPPKSERVKDSDGQKIAKLCGTEWQPRYLVITSDMLIITHPGQSDISDQIPLVNQICINLPHHIIRNYCAATRMRLLRRIE